MSSYFIPIPVSCTDIKRKVYFIFAYETAFSSYESYIGSKSEGYFINLALNLMLPPEGVNFIALEIKFRRIYYSLCSSKYMWLYVWGWLSANEVT